MWRLVREAVKRIARWLGVIPRGTQVDPACFPEDEYPVLCLQCGYTLRGLPDGRCPECGAGFIRGHLLVEQYVRLRRPKTDRYRRLVKRLLVIALPVHGTINLAMFGLWLAVTVAPEWSMDVLFAHDLGPWLRGAFAIAVVSTVALIAATILEIGTLPPADKRKAVRAVARKQTQDRH